MTFSTMLNTMSAGMLRTCGIFALTLLFSLPLGVFVALVSFIGCLWALITALCGKTVAGWASMTCIICFVSGVQLICLGIIGEYIGKIYMESKARPRYIISERTWDEN